MTFDLGTWPLTAWTYEGSHIISINQVWFKSDFNFSNEAIFTFSAYLATWIQMTFDLDTWPLTSSTNKGFRVTSTTLVKIHQSVWKLEPNVNPFFTTDNNYSGQSDPYVSFLLRQATQKLGDEAEVVQCPFMQLISELNHCDSILESLLLILLFSAKANKKNSLLVHRYPSRGSVGQSGNFFFFFFF